MTNKKRRMATVNEMQSNSTQSRWTTGLLLCSLLMISVFGVAHFWQPIVSFWSHSTLTESNLHPVDTRSSVGWQVALHKETEFVSKDTLEKYLKEHLDNSFFSLDVDEALDILEQHAWIKTASARKVWPNTLLIEAREHQPWLNLNNQQLISNEGVIFAPNNIGEFMALPVLEGSFGEIEDLLDMYDFFSKQMPSNAYRISKMKFNAGNGWTLKLENDVELYLGKQELTERLERFFSIANKIMPGQPIKNKSQKEVAYVDLRYQTGIAVGWRSKDSTEQVAQR